MKGQAEIWDDFYKKGRWNKETVKLAQVMKGKKVLELGVGNGKTLLSIMRQKPKEVIAIDISKEALKMIKERNVKLLKANVLSMPFDDEEFDVVVCHYVLNNLMDEWRERSICEIYRVLKKGGKLIFEDFAAGDFRQVGKEIEKNTIEKKDGIISHFFSMDELKKLFGKFSKIAIERRVSNPIRKDKDVKRIIFSGLISK